MAQQQVSHTHRPISREEWQRIHDSGAGDYQRGAWVRENILGVAAMRKRHFAQAHGAVLDVGCGYGANFPYLTNAASITGVDFSPVMLEMAHEFADSLRLNIDLRQTDAEALPFPDAHFDTVISALATCSFTDPVAALREMARVVKPDGQILLLEHGRSTWGWLARYQDRHRAAMIDQGCRWNQEPLEHVHAAGLRVIAASRRFAGVFHAITAATSRHQGTGASTGSR